jgi:16S rRNA (adenine1518-N6/adenine1519-N6)-dimethyltransferase
VIHGDALDLDWAAHLAPPVRIVANLPYNVGTELLVRWLTPDTWPPLWSSMTLMFQREVAERIVAQPGSKAYGRLAILAQWRATARIAMTLPPEAFTPPPKVRSAVVHLDALPAPRFPADPKVLSRWSPPPSTSAARCCAPRSRGRPRISRTACAPPASGRGSAEGVLRPGAGLA